MKTYFEFDSMMTIDSINPLLVCNALFLNSTNECNVDMFTSTVQLFAIHVTTSNPIYTTALNATTRFIQYAEMDSDNSVTFVTEMRIEDNIIGYCVTSAIFVLLTAFIIILEANK
jgi:hypothetical protein